MLGTFGLGGGRQTALLNGFRGMTGESDLSLWAALQVLSSDVVTDDPAFGVVGYGADVTQDQYSWIVQPKDGLRQRVNFVTRQFSVRVDSDRIVQAVMPKNAIDITLTMENITGAAHPGSMRLVGLPAGTWAVVVDGKVQRKVVQRAAVNGELLPPLRLGWSAPAKAQYLLQVVSTSALAGLPGTWVSYPFSSASGSTVPDDSGNNNALTLNGSAAIASEGTRSVLRLPGSGFGRLPDGIMSRATAVTISADVRIDSRVPYQRIFDFGSDANSYMYLTPTGADDALMFGISTSGWPAEARVRTSYLFPVNTWVGIRLTLAPNADGTTTGILYVNGTEAGRNSALRVAPSDLGTTTANYLGKSQFNDPLFAGSIDTFVINGGV